MGSNSVIIASKAGFLVAIIRDLLMDIGFKVLITNNEPDLLQKIVNAYPRYIFIEHCFLNNNTDQYIKKITTVYQNLHIVLWTASELTANEAARFIYAGAESFFSVRDKWETIETIFHRFFMGKTYCPADVEAVLAKENAIPIFNKDLSERQIQILRLIDQKDTDIADNLYITLDTVNYHKKKMYKILGIQSKRELVMYATTNKYIP